MNYYNILQVNKSSTIKEIRASYLNKLKLLHPDKTKDECNNKDIINLNTAYKTLINPNLKLQYDEELNSINKVSLRNQKYFNEISLDEFNEEDDGQLYTYNCRCGEYYKITIDDLEQGLEIYYCSGCSESLRVLYEVAMD